MQSDPKEHPHNWKNWILALFPTLYFHLWDGVLYTVYKHTVRNAFRAAVVTRWYRTGEHCTLTSRKFSTYSSIYISNSLPSEVRCYTYVIFACPIQLFELNDWSSLFNRGGQETHGCEGRLHANLNLFSYHHISSEQLNICAKDLLLWIEFPDSWDSSFLDIITRHCEQSNNASDRKSTRLNSSHRR